ncbi:FkbM family methyltransferase [Nanoarchaeota archaeon]
MDADLFSDFEPSLSLEDVSRALGSEDAFVIFGSGPLVMKVMSFLKSRGKDVTAFLDSDRSKEGSVLEGIEVFHPSNFDFKGKKMILASYQELALAQDLISGYGLKYIDDFFFFIDLVNTEMSGFKDLLGKRFYDHAMQNKDDFLKVWGLLSDGYSKDIFKRLINYRIRALNPESISLESLPCQPSRHAEYEKDAKSYFQELPEAIPADLRTAISFKLSINPYSYFDKVIPENKKVILNCGAYNGNTSGMFAHLSPHSKIYAFEPIEEFFMKNKELSKVFPNIIPVNSGLWSTSGKVSFNKIDNALSGGTASFVGEGEDEIDVVAIDDFVKQSNLSSVDFIKMDVEGAELDALKGAKNTIKDFKPDLAISIYHRAEHLWKIPLWIKDNFPEYMIYIDHKYAGPTETICFATVNR